MMEASTGKTYTYTKTIFELNKQYGIFKFIIVVPTLSIKAGTISFFKNSKDHFLSQYNKTLNLHIVESTKNKKGEKVGLPNGVVTFTKATNTDKSIIHVMLINSHMVISETMKKKFDIRLFDKYRNPFDMLSICHYR